MRASFELNKQLYQAELSAGHDISRDLRGDGTNMESFGGGQPRMYPYGGEGWLLSVPEGGTCNCFWVEFMPHCHGTHTECIGHITREHESISDAINTFHQSAELISIEPEILGNGDRIIRAKQMEEKMTLKGVSAIILRTLPNESSKKDMSYSGSNPPYMEPEACAFLAEQEIDHFLLDLPSVDREDDGGRMLAHKAFWRMDGERRTEATITELIYVPDEVPDGLYLLNLQVANFKLDAAPSRPVLYETYKV